MGRVIVTVLIAGVLGIDGAAQPQELFKLLAADGAAEDRFGQSVSVFEGLALIGSVQDDHVAIRAGSAYVFGISNGQQVTKLTADDAAQDDNFGGSVSLHGNVALVGASHDDDNGNDSGAAYLFDVATGQQLFKLLPSDGAAGDSFGFAVALDGDIAIVTAPSDDDNGWNSGSVYVFDVLTGQQLHKITAGDGTVGDGFGDAVCLSDGTAIVGAPSSDQNGVNSGAAYVLDVALGLQVAKLTPSDAGQSQLFGARVALSANRILIGAFGDQSSAGSAYVFDQATGQQLFKFTASDAASGDTFGQRVALSGRYALIGALHDDDHGTSSGSAYVFDVELGAELYKIVASDAATKDYFAYSVAIDGDVAVVGAIGNDDKGSMSGAAYVINLPPQPFIPFGTGCPGSGGITPQLAMSGSATPGGQVQLDILNGVGSGTAFVFLGLHQAALNMGFDCTLNVAPLLPASAGPVPLFPIGAQGPGAGSISIPATLPPTLAVPVTITLQAFIADPGGAGGFSNSNGVELNIK